MNLLPVRADSLSSWPANIGDFLIWRLASELPNRQIKTVAKISPYIRYIEGLVQHGNKAIIPDLFT